MDLIDSTEKLQAACDRLRQHPFVTVDTEFLRETTFYSKLCLIQLASPDEAILVDPLAADLDLAPFFALMADEAVVKVFHSARQDVEIIWQKGEVIPCPLFDTQVAAMVCGYGDSVSYEQLANDIAKARIDKSSRFTDWSHRPLSEHQLAYALSDVTHLRTLYLALAEELARTGRASWVEEEMAVLTSPATYEMKPENAWMRLRGRVKKTRDLAVLMEVAAWREQEAQTRDVPRSRVMKDDSLIDIATHAPRSAEALGHLRSVPNGFERSRGGTDVLAAIERGLARDPRTIPSLEKPRGKANNGAVLEMLKVLLKAVAENERVAPKILATVDDLEAIAASDHADVPSLRGWRYELFGERAIALKRGQLALSIERGRVVTFER
ncbi:ribonuclease D [Chelatococcus asaccharovorans]|uniref:ribonuclease D n=1 Tax=Chelatococcus asaccharovorans TaxID=28210 RepID=UPI00224C6494|nr:ribonuclease D [Chelatococcus asaccharovorans]CAH1667265.1 Ribonuclease D [Chelatococcus asaccharovorans]CAH1681070.1 Ribonuclease D [Chelatococcus asaccharovorans]